MNRTAWEYRHIGHTLKMQGASVPRSTVEALLSRELDSKGAAERRAHRLRIEEPTGTVGLTTRGTRTVPFLLNFPSTSAVAVTNFCRDVGKLLPWRFQTFAVLFTNCCHGVFKVLPWCSTTLFCRIEVFVTLSKSYFRPFKNKSACLKLK